MRLRCKTEVGSCLGRILKNASAGGGPQNRDPKLLAALGRLPQGEKGRGPSWATPNGEGRRVGARRPSRSLPPIPLRSSVQAKRAEVRGAVDDHARRVGGGIEEVARLRALLGRDAAAPASGLEDAATKARRARRARAGTLSVDSREPRAPRQS